MTKTTVVQLLTQYDMAETASILPSSSSSLSVSKGNNKTKNQDFQTVDNNNNINSNSNTNNTTPCYYQDNRSFESRIIKFLLCFFREMEIAQQIKHMPFISV
eukprot:UN09503